jgi:hypothetical protein
MSTPRTDRAASESSVAVYEESKRLEKELTRLRATLEGIVQYGKLCKPGTAKDCARLIYLAKQALP